MFGDFHNRVVLRAPMHSLDNMQRVESEIPSLRGLPPVCGFLLDHAFASSQNLFNQRFNLPGAEFLEVFNPMVKFGVG